MLRTVEAVLETNGNVRLLEAVELSSARRALVTILNDEAKPEQPAEKSRWARAAEYFASDEGGTPGWEIRSRQGVHSRLSVWLSDLAAS